MAGSARHLPGRFPAAAILFLFFFVFLAAIPAVAGKVRVEKSRRTTPDWIGHVPAADENYLYFVGRASGARTLEDAESDAAANAVRQIVTAIGVEASFNYDRLRREADFLLEDRLSLSGGSHIVGLKRMESYYEKQIINTEDSVKATFNAHVLVRYPRKSLQTEIARLEQESAQRVQTAERLLENALRLEESGSFDGAYRKQIEVVKLTQKPDVHLSGEAARRFAALRRRAIEAARDLSFMLRRVSVEPVEIGDRQSAEPGQASVFTEALENALLKAGFQPGRTEQSTGAGVAPKVVASCREDGVSSLDAGFCFSHWTATISVLDPRDDSVLLSKVYSAKGFGPDPARAGFDAQRKLRLEAFNKFARQARDKFETSFGSGG